MYIVALQVLLIIMLKMTIMLLDIARAAIKNLNRVKPVKLNVESLSKSNRARLFGR